MRGREISRWLRSLREWRVSYEVGVAEGLDRAQGDVSEVADGSGDEGDGGVWGWFRCHQLSGW